MLKCLYLVLSFIFLLGLNIQKVFATDCEIVANALDYLSPQLKEKYKVENCCDIFKNLGRKFDLICSLQKDILTLGFENIDNPNMDLNGFFEEISKMENLSTLEFKNITGPNINVLPSSIGKVKSLLTFKFTDSPSLNLSIPDEIGELKSLQTLNLSNNGIKGDIPISLGNLKSLYSLNLSGNSFSGYIPYEFNNLKRLRQLIINDNSDVKGYVPLLDIETCNYEGTQLCNLSTAKCTSGGTTCTKNDIVDTHANNGNPDPSSDTAVDPSTAPAEGFIGTKSNNNSKKNEEGGDKKYIIIAVLVGLCVLIFLANLKFKFIHCGKKETSNETTTPALPSASNETTSTPYQATPNPYQAAPNPYQAAPNPYQANPNLYEVTPPYQVPPSSYQVAPPSSYQFNPTPNQVNPSAPSGY